MEEKFCDLLEEYLNEEEISIKKEQDEEFFLNSNENTKKKASPFGLENTISIQEYATQYLGFKGNYETLLHCGLKELKCPYVVGVDNRFANKNPELVYKGFLLLVLDYKKRRGTYINPIYLRKMITRFDERALLLLQRQRIHDLEKLQLLFAQYECLKEQVEKNQAFLELLRKLHKNEKLEELEQLELSLGRKKL